MSLNKTDLYSLLVSCALLYKFGTTYFRFVLHCVHDLYSLLEIYVTLYKIYTTTLYTICIAYLRFVLQFTIHVSVLLTWDMCYTVQNLHVLLQVCITLY